MISAWLTWSVLWDRPTQFGGPEQSEVVFGPPDTITGDPAAQSWVEGNDLGPSAVTILGLLDPARERTRNTYCGGSPPSVDSRRSGSGGGGWRNRA